MTRYALAPVVLLAGLGIDCHGARERPAERLAADIAALATAAAPAPEPAAPVDPSPAPAPEPPATRYASLSATGCAAALAERAIPHEALGPVRGVEMPVRLTGPLSGVTFRTLLPEKQRARSKYEIVDCRLVLALDDFAKLLAEAHVTEAVHYSAYRPAPPGWLTGPYGLRHEGGLAMDVAAFRLDNGLALNVARDFDPRRGERLCVPGPLPRTATVQSLALRKLVCNAHEARLFHLALTPAYDEMHHDHFHLEVTPGATDFTAR